MFRGISVLAIILAGLSGEAAFAQNAPALSDAAKALLGNWELSNADRDRTCSVIFRGEPAAGGLKLDLDPACANVLAATKDIAAWLLADDGALRLINAAGNPVLELTEVESGIYDGSRPGEGRYVLQNTAGVPVRKADDLFGEWAIARGTGKPICAMTLARDAAGAENFALRIKPGCDAFVRSFGPTAWRIANGELVLSSPRGQIWRFEENDANTWQRVPETPDPVLLVRQQ